MKHELQESGKEKKMGGGGGGLNNTFRLGLALQSK